MTLNSPPPADTQNLFVYKWKEKSQSTVAVNGTETTFTFEAISGVRLVNLTGVLSTVTAAQPDIYTEDASHGKYTYYQYKSGAWVKSTGTLAGYDCKVYFRKNGIDTPVDGGSSSITSVSEGASKIEVIFAQAPTTAIADYVVLSYAYTDVSNPEPTEFCVTEYSPKYSGRDYKVTQCFGGKSFTHRDPLDLTEVSIKVLKLDHALSSIMMGDRSYNTIGTTTVRNMTGGNYTYPRALVIKVDDPDDSTKKLVMLFRNIGATACDFSSTPDAEMAENITFKTVAEHTIGLEI